MDTGLVYFVLGILVSVPLSVLANLATPRVRGWWDSRSERGRLKNAESARNREDLLRVLTNEPHLLSDYLAERHAFVLEIMLLGLGLVVIAFTLPLAALVADRPVPEAIRVMDLLVSVLSGLGGGLGLALGAVWSIATQATYSAVQKRRAEAGLPFIPSRRSRREKWVERG